VESHCSCSYLFYACSDSVLSYAEQKHQEEKNKALFVHRENMVKRAEGLRVRDNPKQNWCCKHCWESPCIDLVLEEFPILLLVAKPELPDHQGVRGKICFFVAPTHGEFQWRLQHVEMENPPPVDAARLVEVVEGGKSRNLERKTDEERPACFKD
jgi:hypothetical protein